MAKKSKVKKIITSLVSASLIAGGLYAIFRGFKNNPEHNNNPPKTQLREVSNVSYDTKSSHIMWEEVEHADAYEVDVNGSKMTTETNSIYYVPTITTSEIKVRAYDTTGEYLTSDWSIPYVYTVQENQMTLSSISTFVSSMLPENIKLQKVVSMHAEGQYLYTSAVFEKGKVDYLYELQSEYDQNIVSLKEAMTNEDIQKYTRINKMYEVANYNSAEYLLKSDQYSGKMEEYRSAGYDFSIVSSQAYKTDRHSLGINTTFKIENGNEEKYVCVKHLCGVTDTAIESKKYTVSLVNLEPENILEESFVELTGDFAEFAQILESQSAESSQSYEDGGMSY